MPRSPFPTFTIGVRAVLLAAALLSGVQAAELGDIAVRSHIGQPLTAEIELVDLAQDEIGQLQVGLAGPNIYKGANVGVNPVLSSLRMSVVRRDGRHFLHLTSSQPVQSELLHLFLELAGGKQTSVRAATLWLTPDPAPAAVRTAAVLAPPAATPTTPVPVVSPSGSAPSEAALAVARARLAARESARRPAPPAAAPAPVPVPVSAQPRAAAPDAATVKVAKAASNASATPAAPAATTAKIASTAGVLDTVKVASKAESAKPATPAAAIPGPQMPVAPAPAATCTPRQMSDKLKQCIALNGNSQELTSKLVELEGKVDVLQAALRPAAAAAMALPVSAPVPKAAEPVKPGVVIPPSPAAAKAAAARAKAKERKAANNLMTVIAAGSVALLLAIGVTVHFVRRRLAKRSSGPLQIWQSWRKKKTEAAAESASAEPVLGAD